MKDGLVVSSCPQVYPYSILNQLMDFMKLSMNIRYHSTFVLFRVLPTFISAWWLSDFMRWERHRVMKFYVVTASPNMYTFC
jgi:hypothetical protein